MLITWSIYMTSLMPRHFVYDLKEGSSLSTGPAISTVTPTCTNKEGISQQNTLSLIAQAHGEMMEGSLQQLLKKHNCLHGML